MVSLVHQEKMELMYVLINSFTFYTVINVINKLVIA